MELKGSSQVIQGSRSAFQSHLYGIESAEKDVESSLILVSIAPLWNWKYQNLYANVWYGSFNRTFMELKANRSSVMLTVAAVSIAPLWNWKILKNQRSLVLSTVSIAPLWNWKTRTPTPLHCWLRVSIAPLWNWKERGERRFQAVARFNRTFMELKVSTCWKMRWFFTFQSHLYGIERRPPPNML